MFAWFKRLIREYEVGQKMAQSFANDLDNLSSRYKPISEGYLGLLQGRLNKCLNPTDGPPLLVGPIEYKLFVDNVGELRGRMTGEIGATLSKWIEVAEQMQSRDKFDQLIQVVVDRFCNELSQTGLQRLLDMAHALKAADDQWRVAHHESAAKFPPDVVAAQVSGIVGRELACVISGQPST